MAFVSGKVVLDLSPLKGLQAALKNRILRQSMTQAGKAVRQAVKANAQAVADTGGLAKCIGIKVKTYRTNNVTVAVIGPRSKWTKTIRPKGGRTERVYRPSKVAHIIERGSKRSTGRHPLGNALAGTQDEFKAILNRAIRDGINRQLAKTKA